MTVVSRVTAIYRAVIYRLDCSRFCHVLVQVDLALAKIMGRLAHNTKRVTKSRYRKREKEYTPNSRCRLSSCLVAINVFRQ